MPAGRLQCPTLLASAACSCGLWIERKGQSKAYVSGAWGQLWVSKSKPIWRLLAW